MAAGWYKAWPRCQMPCAWDSEECLAGRDPGETKPPFFPGNGNHTTYKHGDDKRGWFNFVLPASVVFFNFSDACRFVRLII